MHGCALAQSAITFAGEGRVSVPAPIQKGAELLSCKAESTASKIEAARLGDQIEGVKQLVCLV